MTFIANETNVTAFDVKCNESELISFLRYCIRNTIVYVSQHVVNHFLTLWRNNEFISNRTGVIKHYSIEFKWAFVVLSNEEISKTRISHYFKSSVFN